MMHVVNVSSEFGEFCTWLAKNREGAVETIGRLANGFEGWLKVEFLMWLTSKGFVLDEDVGIEYKVKLDPTVDVGEDQWKQCDLWIRADRDRYHYIELKAPFANRNSGKMMRAAGYDLWYMSRLRAREERVATGNAIVVGVGFSDENWDRARARVRESAGIESTVHPTAGQLLKVIRYDVWTKEY